MIFPNMIRQEATKFLNEALAEAPGALKEVTESQRLELFIREATEKANQIELYSIKQGFRKWNWKDFTRKATAEYARSILDALEHRASKMYQNDL
jgi:N12 class adenine-specific DNA methylase